ncbi:MAG: hypothetical protein JSS10_03360 [Verrucomicrobia bacterium]|nr:hypothetical protein [Verrucomicrobiota bacterium]
MAWNPKKVWPLTVASLVTYSGLLNGADVGESGNQSGEHPIVLRDQAATAPLLSYSSPSREYNNYSQKSKPAENPMTAVDLNEETPFLSDTRYEVQGGANLFMTADFLYWTAREKGLAYAIKDGFRGVSTVPGFLSESSPGHHAKVKEIGHTWNPGWRVGLGYNTPHDKWDLYLNWTHYRQDVHNSVHANDHQQIFTLWQVNPLNALTGRSFSCFCTEAKGEWKLHYDTLDLELGRSFGFTPHLSLRPHVGVRAARIYQDFEIHYKNLFENRNADNARVRAIPKLDTDMRNHFLGLGLRGGVDTKWKFTRDWGVFANGSGSILWGRFNDKVKDKIIGQPLLVPSGTSMVDLHDHHVSFVGNLQIALGMSWDHYFSDHRYHLGLTLGWEQLIWFNQNQLDHLDSESVAGQFFKETSNLGLSGVTLGARFDF